jgi:hypothetical protein
MDFNKHKEGAIRYDARSCDDRRQRNVAISHQDRRTKQRRNTELQAFLWANNQTGLRT